jgi:hypothetical protein
MDDISAQALFPGSLVHEAPDFLGRPPFIGITFSLTQTIQFQKEV